MNKKLYSFALLLSGIFFLSIQGMEENLQKQEKKDTSFILLFHCPKEQENIVTLLTTKTKSEAETEIEKYCKENKYLGQSSNFKVDRYDILSSFCSPLYYLVGKKSLLTLGVKFMIQAAQP